MSEQQLMNDVHAKWGALIDQAVENSPLPAAFLGALIANESDGDPIATRFEPAVYAHLKIKFPTWDDQRVRDNATSWGLTQIMGENYPGPPKDLADPKVNLTHAMVMLEDFARSYFLDLEQDFEPLFRCWNTGGPVGHTYDPLYVPRGISRMKLWPVETA